MRAWVGEEQKGNEGVATRQLASNARHSYTEGHTAGTLLSAIAPASPSASTASTPRPSILRVKMLNLDTLKTPVYGTPPTNFFLISQNQFFLHLHEDRSLMVRGQAVASARARPVAALPPSLPSAKGGCRAGRGAALLCGTLSAWVWCPGSLALRRRLGALSGTVKQAPCSRHPPAGRANIAHKRLDSFRFVRAGPRRAWPVVLNGV